MVLIYIFLKDNFIECLFIYVFAICMSLHKYLFVSWWFSNFIVHSFIYILYMRHIYAYVYTFWFLAVLGFELRTSSLPTLYYLSHLRKHFLLLVYFSFRTSHIFSLGSASYLYLPCSWDYICHHAGLNVNFWLNVWLHLLSYRLKLVILSFAQISESEFFNFDEVLSFNYSCYIKHSFLASNIRIYPEDFLLCFPPKLSFTSYYSIF
jgi:hypothetical protein